VAAAAAEGLHVTCLPGPSAVTTALVLSGLPVERFCFEGFAPRREGERRRWLATLRTEPRAVVFFEAPHRLDDTLRAAVDVLGGERAAAVCRELTKKHEEVRRGTLAELAAGAEADPVRGEVTVVLAGAAPAPAPEVGSLVGAVRERVADGERLKDAAAAVAQAAGVPKRELYNAALADRDRG
jgi:16S rRNA (cytidine1402-2'-O)-methyltransferase